MNATVVFTVGCLVNLVGAAGCVIPVLPGPLIAYGSLWWLVLCGVQVPTYQLVWGAAVVVLVTLFDYILPAVFARKFKCSRWGTFGCFVGTIVGLFFFPLGLVLGPFLGAFLGELVAGCRVWTAVKGGLGALLGFLSGLFLKFAAFALFVFWFVSDCPI